MGLACRPSNRRAQLREAAVGNGEEDWVGQNATGPQSEKEALAGYMQDGLPHVDGHSVLINTTTQKRGARAFDPQRLTTN